jgi:hypothetical protein
MGRTIPRSGLRISHLLIVVAASAFMLVLLKSPLDYALPLVSAAGFLVIGSCLVAAIVHDARDRRVHGRGSPRLCWLLTGMIVAILAMVGLILIPHLLFPMLMGRWWSSPR